MKRLKSFLVTWEIDLEASTAHEAAVLALAIHRDHDSIATVFDVYEKTKGDRTKKHRIDLSSAPWKNLCESGREGYKGHVRKGFRPGTGLR